MISFMFLFLWQSLCWVWAFSLPRGGWAPFSV